MPRHHVVITGTGRAGTSFLVQLLTHLGVDTGINFNDSDINSRWAPYARAGLEHDIQKEDVPYVIKDPVFCDIVESVLARDDIAIDHVFIPMRDLYAAAESRRHVVQSSMEAMNEEQRQGIKPRQIPGGLWSTDNPGDQEAVLLVKFYRLMHALSKTSIPVTLMQYPRITTDEKYLYEKLRPLLGSIEFGTFSTVFAQTVRPEWVHQFGNNDR
jgi:hypothetical protein